MYTTGGDKTSWRNDVLLHVSAAHWRGKTMWVTRSKLNVHIGCVEITALEKIVLERSRCCTFSLR